MLDINIFGLAVWQWALLVGVLGAATFFGIKILPVKNPQTAKAIGVVAIIIGLIGGGYLGPLLGPVAQQLPGAGPVATSVSGILVDSEGSETDANLTYDAPLRLFTLAFYENWLGGTVVKPTALGTTITSVTLSITVFELGASGDNEAVTVSIRSTVPTYLDDNAKVRSPVDKDTDLNQWKVAMTPTGGSARNERQTMSVPAGGSKAMSIVTTLDSEDSRILDNFQSIEVKFYIEDARGNELDSPYRLRIIKTGVDHTA